MGRSDFSPGFGHSSLPPRILPPSSGPEEISWGKVEQCPAAPALSTRLPRSDIGRRVAQHTCPGQTSLHEGSLAFGAAVRIQLPSHTPSRERRRLSITANLHLVQLPSTRGCLRQAPQGTRTPNHSTMPSAMRYGLRPPLRRRPTQRRLEPLPETTYHHPLQRDHLSFNNQRDIPCTDQNYRSDYYLNTHHPKSIR